MIVSELLLPILLECHIWNSKLSGERASLCLPSWAAPNPPALCWPGTQTWGSGSSRQLLSVAKAAGSVPTFWQRTHRAVSSVREKEREGERGQVGRSVGERGSTSVPWWCPEAGHRVLMDNQGGLQRPRDWAERSSCLPSMECLDGRPHGLEGTRDE